MKDLKQIFADNADFGDGTFGKYMKEDTFIEVVNKVKNDYFVDGFQKGYKSAKDETASVTDSEIEKAAEVKLNIPTDDQLIKAAILFNDGMLDQRMLSNMVAYATWILDRLSENNDITKPCKKETE